MSRIADGDGPEVGDRRAAARRVLVWIVGALLALLVLVLLLRIFIRPIPPDQEAPLGHFGEPCWACHLISESADPVELP